MWVVLPNYIALFQRFQTKNRKYFDNWVAKDGWLVVGIDHYLEHEESLTWPEHVGVHMTTLSTQEWKDAWHDAGFTNISSWQAGEKSAVTLVIAGQKID